MNLVSTNDLKHNGLQKLIELNRIKILINFLFKAVLKLTIENYSEMFGYINTGRANIRIHRDIEGKMWFWVGVYALPPVSYIYNIRLII